MKVFKSNNNTFIKQLLDVINFNLMRNIINKCSLNSKLNLNWNKISPS